MFVSKLDRPWIQTPFPIQGFYIHDPCEIQQLKVHCNHVYIDVKKGTAPDLSFKPQIAKGDTKEIKRQRAKKIKVKPIRVNKTVYTSYPKPRRMQREIKKADRLYQQVYRSVASVLKQAQNSQTIDAVGTVQAAGDMVDSILRNPDAFIWLSRMREKDEHTYSHVVRAAIWAIMYGRHLGLERNEINILATSVLLKDIGKTSLPKDILVKSERNVAEQAVYETFVQRSVDMLKQSPAIPKRVIQTVYAHKEYLNGTGFPNQLTGDKIPLLAKIAGIVTFYDETTNPRESNPLSPSRGIAKLYDMRDIEFQEDLVVQFIQAIGLYPSGTFVELNTGAIGVVIEQNKSLRLKPNILVLQDEFKTPVFEPYIITLSHYGTDSKVELSNAAEGLSIARDLEPDAIHVNLEKIREQFIVQHRPKGVLGGLRTYFGRD